MWDWLKRIFEALYDRLVKFLVGIYEKLRDYLKSLVDSILAFYQSIVKNIFEIVSSTYTYIKDTAKRLWQDAWNTVKGYWDALWEQYKEWCIWVVDTAMWLFDYVVSWGFDMILWVIDQLPGLEGQEGYKEGMKRFLELVAAVNKFMPVVEMVMMIGLFVTIYTMVVSYRFVKQWIPTISN